MTFSFRVTYKIHNEDGSYTLKYGYVHAKDISDAWEKAREKFGDVRAVR